MRSDQYVLLQGLSLRSERHGGDQLNYQDQLQPGTLEHAVLVCHEQDLSLMAARCPPVPKEWSDTFKKLGEKRGLPGWLSQMTG